MQQEWRHAIAVRRLARGPEKSWKSREGEKEGLKSPDEGAQRAEGELTADAATLVWKENLEDTKGERRAAPCPLRVAPVKSW